MQSCETSPVTEIGMIIHTDTHITDGNNVVIAQPLKISLTMSVNHCLTSTDTGTAVHVKILHRMACVRCSRPIKNTAKQSNIYPVYVSLHHCIHQSFESNYLILAKKWFSLKLKGKVYDSCVQSCVIHGSENWPMKVQYETKVKHEWNEYDRMNVYDSLHWKKGTKKQNSRELKLSLEPVNLGNHIRAD